MKKIFQNQAVAWVVLILAVALAAFWGQQRRASYEAKKSTELLDVSYYNWICDDAKLLSDATENAVKEYNTSWNEKYYAVTAVATLPRLNGWTEADYAKALGEKWGLGAGDMLLLLVKGGDWYVACGDSVLDTMTDTQQTKLKQAIDEPYYAGNYDEAVVAFFRQADVYYAQAAPGFSGGSSGSSTGTAQEWTEYKEPKASGHVSIFGVILLVVGVLVVWAIIDRFRYNRYRRRSAVVVTGAPRVSYYPIFWGRSTYRAPVPPAPPAAPPRPARPHSYSSSYKRPANASRPSGSYQSSSRPSGGTSRPGGNSRPSGGFGKGGFGGGKR
ncbi:MAG: hypothetical protein E7426_06035 [Ruminococcaceae bacterium]|jgi:uncharacterized membrane protein YgcG|nr:hypothetical protein [Oscillospiraceae bacterium]